MKKRQRAVHSTVNAGTETRNAIALVALSTLLLVGAQSAYAQTETVLHSFAGPPDGATPIFATLVLDKQENLYGVTVFGGAYNLGTVFEITPSGTEKVLWSFGNGTDGSEPVGVAVDNAGNLYGTSAAGGAYNLGTVWKLTPSGTETVLWSFGNGTDGSAPQGPVIDGNGNLYGTTLSGGAYGLGTTWELTPSGTETVRWSFGNGEDGAQPEGVVLDKAGNLYGVTYYGGAYQCGNIGCGTAFKLTPAGTETILWNFGNGTDGYEPLSAPVLDSQGNLYGTTPSGGVYGNGTVFKITP